MELYLTLFLPLIGAFLLMFLNKENVALIKNVTLGITIVTFLVSLGLYIGFDNSNPDFQFVQEFTWIKSLDTGFRIGVDGMGLLMVLLTTFISPIAILGSYKAIEKREKEFYIMMLILQFAMTGVFVALDLFLFYVCWEIVLIPMYFIIGIWGGKNRMYATVKFFIYTVVGSLFMLVAVIWLAYYVGNNVLHLESGFTTNYLLIKDNIANLPFDLQKWMFTAFALSFLIKVPIFPLHTWLPDAHTEAPTPGSVILAALLLKMGTYGLVRFNLELFPLASAEYAGFLSLLAVIGIIYGAVVAMIQTDFKKLVAYTSVSHLGFVVLGIFSMNEDGVQGAIIQMVNHGLSTGMLFLLIGMIYERRHTRQIADYGGIMRVMPAYGVFFGIAMFSSIGLPGLNGFVGEFLTLNAAFHSPFLDSYWYTAFGTTGVIFAAVYLLWMYQRIFFGEIDKEENKTLTDLTKREWAVLTPLVIFIVWIGLYSAPFMNISAASTKKLIKKIETITNIQNASTLLNK